MGILRIDKSVSAHNGCDWHAFATIFLSIMICNGNETPYRLRISVSFMLSCVSSHLAVSAHGIEQDKVAYIFKAILDRTMGLELVDHAARSMP